MALFLETQKNPFWSLTIEKTVELLETDLENGISDADAIERLQIFGANMIEKPRHARGLLIFLRQFKSPLILILLAAGIVTFAIGHHRDSFFILAAVVVNVILGFYQEFKAERALAELNTYLKQRCRVIRAGVEQEIDAADLVPGDILRLAQGDRAPADARLFFVNDLQIDESVLTGESLPVGKAVAPTNSEAVLGDQSSMVFAGTLVAQGVGTAVICRTDFATELGKIAAMVADTHAEETPLQAAIRRFSLRLGLILGILTLIVFGTGISLGYSWFEMFVTSVAIAVSAVPEGLPIAMTVILATGVQRMARRKGVVRKLIAAEALGSTTTILTDKTGTLTAAKMELGKIFPTPGEKEERLLELALANTSVLIENPGDPASEWRMDGRTIEVAMVRSAATRGVDIVKTKEKFSILNSLPFNAVNKFSVSLVREHGKDILVFFGAPDILARRSVLDDARRADIMKKIDDLAGAGELVLGVAVREVRTDEEFDFAKEIALHGLSLRGLITLRDPVRPGVKEAIRRVELAGIKTIVMSGDHRGTAESIAREVGLPVQDNGVLDATEMKGMSDEDLKQRLVSVRVIARVSPGDKLRIVRLFQEMGEVVAMTGDGVNDAPSIKQADVGVAMGSGTEVAREVADLVLLDDNFETIAAAVEEGREIMGNIRKVIVYLVSSVADSIFLIGGSLVFGLTLPLSALQILWVNFFSDSFPAIAFAFERGIDGLGSGRNKQNKDLFSPVMKFLVWVVGSVTSALLFILYWYLLRSGFAPETVRTFMFACFGTYMLFLALSVRSLEKSIFEYSLFSNRYLIIALLIGLTLMTGAVYLPFLQTILGTVALPWSWVAGVVMVGMVNIAAVELGKWIFRRKATLVTEMVK